MASASRTLGSDLKAFLRNEDRCDVTLVGTDGGRVPASRLVLAARSKVFESMLFGRFQESLSSEISLDFPSDILRSVAEFCCTDNLTQFEGRGDERAAREMAQLFACADYLQLDVLGIKVDALARSLMSKRECLACAVYDEAWELSSGETVLMRSALEVIRSRPRRALLPGEDGDDDDDDDSNMCGGGVISLKPAALRELVRDRQMNVDEATVFRALQRWADDVPSDGDGNAERRIDVARKCVVDIDLTRIRPSELVGFVTESGLVASEVVTKALVDQALQAEKEGFVFAKQRDGGAGTINVEMAGSRDCLGTYTPRNLVIDDVIIVKAFARDAYWNGREVTFCICSTREERYCQWRIFSFNRNERIDGLGDCFHFYQTLRQDITHGLMLTDAPPVSWVSCSFGRNPPPTIRWIPN